MSNGNPSRNWTVRLAKFLERVAGVALHFGRDGIILVTPLLLGYVLFGTMLTWTGLVIFPYPFLSVASDPVFNVLGFVAGIAIILTSGGLLVLLLMTDLRRVENQFALLLVGIGLGSGFAVLRYTYETPVAGFLAILKLLFELSMIS